MKTMKKLMVLSLIVSVFSLVAFKPIEGKLVSKDTHVSFFSHTAVEDITANNYKVTSTIETSTGAIVFSVPMQSFEFDKSLMQEHFNGKNFLNTKKFPKAKFIGNIDNLSVINFNEDGEYAAMISGELEIKGAKKAINEKATITVIGGKVTLTTTMNLTLADFGVTFKKGKPSKNIAKDIEITVKAIYNN
ncbi:MAG: YceI family protein [Flavobacteriaceae bacterium]